MRPLKKCSFVSDLKSSFDIAPGMGGTHLQAGVELTGCAGGFQPALPSCRSRPSHPVRFVERKDRNSLLFNDQKKIGEIA
ncbi:hypothetical protein LQ50_05790 [Halalkalibacter okhensis]|uniref:Uncharacterized protein n=1 Tax=Halalkalibacter okhensis TaxID=333138 RepID=A0A0B0IK64_9BACI|nr:hypothetical protein LQ50_05790 [Halalkalibacter okhensis]